MVNANAKSSWLRFLPHKFEEGVLPHYIDDDLECLFDGDPPKRLLDRALVVAKTAASDVVLWTNLTPHASFPDRDRCVLKLVWTAKSSCSCPLLVDYRVFGRVVGLAAALVD